MSKLHKKINIEALPTKKGVGINYNKQIIDYNKSIGRVLNFEYGDKKGHLKIINYIKPNLIIEHEGEYFNISTESLKSCNLGKILKLRTNEFKIEVGSTLTDNNRNLVILDRDYRIKQMQNGFNRYEKWYYFKCNKCGILDWKIEPSLLNSKSGCPVCSSNHHIIVEGINDIPTTAPWMIKYFQGGYNEAKKYAKYSNQLTDAVCPDCGKIYNNVKISKISTSKGLNCSCSDGWSYPNKFIYNLFEQINLNFDPEKLFDWSNGKIYDDFIKYENMQIIVENHGLFHYKSNKLSKRTLIEEQENDRLKEQLAKTNGIDHYIVLDCRKSELEWIKKSVLESELPALFNFMEDDIDWLKCEEYALKNLVKEICTYKKNNPDMGSDDISKKYKIARGTVIKYLYKGDKFGWCKYNKREEYLRKRYSNTRNNGEIPILCIETNEVFRSSPMCASILNSRPNVKVIDRNIRNVCEGKRNMCGNFRFKHITKEEFNKIKSESPELAFGDFFILEDNHTEVSA